MNSLTSMWSSSHDPKNLLRWRWLCIGVAGAMLALGLPDALAQKTWDGGAGTNNWMDANNWNTDGVPSATGAIIDFTNATVSLATTAPNITSLSIANGNTVRTSTLNIGTGGALNGTFLSVGGSNGNGYMNLSGNATLVFSGTMTVGGTGNFDGGLGVLSIADTASLSVTNATLGVRCVSGTINQSGGTLNITGIPTASGNLVLGQTDHTRDDLGDQNQSGYYNLSAGTVNVNGTTHVGYAGRGTTAAIKPDAVGVFTQTGGTVNAGGAGLSEAMSIQGALRLATTPGFGASGRSMGTYKLQAGSLTVRGAVIIGNFTNAEGTYSGAGVFELGTADGTATTFEQYGGTGGTARGIIVRNTANTDGTFTGWGTVAFTGTLTNNGRVIANGFGTSRSLDFSSMTSVANTIENGAAGQALNKDISGWYAINKGKLILPGAVVDNSAGTYTYNLGEASADTDIDLVNSVRITLTKVGTNPYQLGDTNNDGTVDVTDFNNVQNNFGATGANVLGDTNNDGIVDVTDFNNVQNNFGAVATTGTHKVSYNLYDRNHASVPSLPGDALVASLWNITPTFTISSANMVFRYDDALSTTLGITETNLKLYRYNTGTLAWEQVPNSSLDTTNNRIAATGLTSLGWFAIGTMNVGETPTQQVDLSINSDSDSNYYSDNTYQTTPSGDQIQTAIKDRTTLWTWNVRVQNDGTNAQPYTLKATGTSGSGWTVTYKYNSTNIGTDILGSSGWTTPSIAVGDYITVNVEVTADDTVVYGATKDVVVNAGYVDGGNYVVQDSVKGTYQVNNSSGEYDLITDFGGNLFYETYWGNLTVTPLGNGTSRITRSGGTAFDANFVGKMFESARIHKNPATYPSTGANYIPLAVTVRYATVIIVESDTSLIVNFEYNGGNPTTPQATANTDGIFFYNNKTALQNWASSPTRKSEVRWDGILAIFGIPNITVTSDMSFKDSSGGKDNIYIKLMYSDDFDVSANGDSNCPTWATQYGSTKNMFSFGNGQINIDLPQILPTLYTMPSVQYGSAGITLLYDTASTTSTATGTKKTYNWQQYKERDEMVAALGSVRPGAVFCLPDLGYCVGGGTHDGTDITAMNIYEIDGGWVAKNPMNFKAKFKSGILFWIYGREDQRADFIEKTSLKATSYPGIQSKFIDNRTCVVNDPLFTFYQVCNQYWLGGTSNSGTDPNECRITISGTQYTLYYGNMGDWSHEAGSNNVTVLINGQTVKFFDRIPVANNTITMGVGSLGAFASSNVVRIWGWAMVPGTQLSISGTTYTVTSVSRLYTTSGIYNGGAAHYFDCTLSGTPTQTTTATVVSSPLSVLLDGNYRSADHIYNRDANGHLCYTDQETNMRWENVNYCGYVRATGEYDGSNDLYKMTSIAEFTNVFCVNEDGTPSYSQGREFNPVSLRRRQQLTGNNNYRVKISGGRIYWGRGDDTQPEVIFTNRPQLIYGSASYGEPRLLNPIMGDTQGLIIGSGDGTSAPFNEIGCSIVLSNNTSLDLSNSELRGQLIVAGHGSVNLSNLTTMLTTGSQTQYYGCEIAGSVGGVTTPTLWNLSLTGSGGQGGFRQLYTYAIGALSFNLTNWTLQPTYYAGDGFVSTQNTSDPNYCNYISINGQCLN